MDEDIFALFIGLVAVVLGSLVVLIPIVGLTARFALRSWIDRALSLMEQRQANQPAQLTAEVQRLQQRVAWLEQEMEGNVRQTKLLLERTEFDERLADTALEAAMSSTTTP